MNLGQAAVPKETHSVPKSAFSWDSCLTVRRCRLYLFVGCLHRIQFEIGQSLDIDHLISSLVHGPDQLIQLQIDRAGIAVLSVLDEEDHEKGYEGRSHTDDLRPPV